MDSLDLPETHQWCGEGLAAGDVAYLICTSVEPEALCREQELLRYYHAQLSSRLEEHWPNSPPGYTFEEFLEDYRVAYLDYLT